MTAAVETLVAYTEGPITCTAGAAITAGTFVKPSVTKAVGANLTVIPCGAAGAALGVALFSAASGELVTVQLLNDGGVMGVLVGTGGVTVGQRVESDATGQAVTFSAGVPLGLTITTTTATNTALIALGS